MKQKKIAIFTSYLDNIGGTELVTLILARDLDADIYTTNINYEKIKKMGFENLRIFSIGNVPKNPPFRQQSVFSKFRKIDLKDKYDFYIISGDWAMPALVKNKPNLWYAYSPINEVFAFKNFVKEFLPLWKKPLFEIWALYVRQLAKSYAKKTRKIICISKVTQNRVKKYFKKDSSIIYPPTETYKFKNKKSKNYWLSVNRLNIHKRVDIQMNAFSKLPKEKLIIVGSYEKGAKHFEENFHFLEKIKPNNVEIKSWVSFEELINLYSNCKGFITTAQDEDFGMTPVEAMASGKPIIAGNEGGYKETVIDGKTGILIDDIDSDKLIQAVKKISEELKKNPNKYKKACIKRAKEFDTSVFIKKMKDEIENE